MTNIGHRVTNIEYQRSIKRLFMAFLCFFLLFSADTTLAQKKFVVGRVLSDKTKTGLNHITVTNKRTGQLSRTNHLGNFFLWAEEGDSLVATHNAYGRTAISWDGKTEEPVIVVEKLAIVLPEVVIKTKREGILQQEIDRLLREPEAKRNLSLDEALALAQSPINMLYELFGKRPKSDRKLAVLMQQDRRKRYAGLRLDAVTSQVTDYRGDDLEDFKQFCNFSEDFLLNATEYDLTYWTLQRVKQYQRSLRR